MYKTDPHRIDPKRRATIDPKRKQFAALVHEVNEYPHRLNFYDVPPTAEISLEQFEQWAIDRMRVLTALETASFRNLTAEETTSHIKPILQKYLPLSANSSSSASIPSERQKDHYSHFILRLAFSRTPELRQRFARLETQLFKHRWNSDDARERRAFIDSIDLALETVSPEEKRALSSELQAGTSFLKKGEFETELFYKVAWERATDLVGQRSCLLRAGKAYVPSRDHLSLIASEFLTRLDAALVQTSKALPRLDEDSRLMPILEHFGKSFTAPSATGDDADGSQSLTGRVSAASIDRLSVHFPACMRHLHLSLRRDAHLKHYARLQYMLFLKGLGLSLDDALQFWRGAFRNMSDDKYAKEYRYNVRHAYGDVGGDANRRGKGYAPKSCQRILTEAAPGPGEAHGCPYRHFGAENLETLLRGPMGVTDEGVLRGVKEDVGAKRYHIGCNRVFGHVYKAEIEVAAKEGVLGREDGDIMLHPNVYFKRAYMLTHLGQEVPGGGEGKGEVAGGGDAMDMEE